MAGRFAPSPTGRLHVGNLRTALVAWLSARAQGLAFLVRMEDLDRVTSSADHERAQLADLAALGLDWDGEVVRQSERFARYDAAIERLTAADLVYPCYCTRREIRAEIEAAPRAPHGEQPDGAYPGTCRDLGARQRAAREAEGRRPAWRLRGGDVELGVDDALVGSTAGTVDDVVVRRGDGVPAYNLAVVVDDAAQGITEVVRGDDLLSSTPRQVHLQRLLGLPTPRYVHVPLVLGADGQRLAKRHGAVTLAELATAGHAAGEVLGWMATSLGLAAPGEAITAAELVERFAVERLPRQPATFTAASWSSTSSSSTSSSSSSATADTIGHLLRGTSEGGRRAHEP
jgi:glutamyl-tRNA synthetase